MKLYYAAGACSLSPHIVLIEAGYNFDLERVDLKTKKTESGKDFATLSDKGYVPMLVLENGETLSEGAAMVQYLADEKPQSKLAPKAGTMERVRLNEWLTYISSEVHKGFSPLFYKVNDEAVEFAKKKLFQRFDYIDKKLQGNDFLMGSNFTIADAYLFTVLNWSHMFKFDLSKWSNINAYMQRISKRPSVQEAMKAEGLLKAAA
jgi:glutathione S-transferase